MRVSERTHRVSTKVKNRVDPDALRAQREGTTEEPLGTPNNPSNQILTVANVITLCRFVLTLVFLYLFVNHGNRAVAVTCYVVAAVTDFLDGQVARRTQTVSWVGKVADPIMDRVLLFTGVLGLVWVGELPLWIACFVILRDAYLLAGAMIVQRYRRRPIDVVYVGKGATACLMAGFADMLLGLPQVHPLGLVSASWLPGLNSQPAALGIFLIYLGLVLSTIAAVAYTKEGFAIRREVLDKRATGAEEAVCR